MDGSNYWLEQYALTEASFAMVKLMQRFSTIENGAPEIEQPIIKSNLTVSHGQGVKVRLY